jgi:YHS domain-containing protein
VQACFHSFPHRRGARPVCPRVRDETKLTTGFFNHTHIKIMNIKSTIAIIAAALLSCTAAFAEFGVPKSYPLKKCPVTGDKLGEMGKPVKATYEGTDVWLCCKSCLKDFKKDPAKYVKMVKDAGKKK